MTGYPVACVCLSVHPANAVGQNEMPFARTLMWSQVTLIAKVSPKPIKLETSNLAYSFIWATPTKLANIF